MNNDADNTDAVVRNKRDTRRKLSTISAPKLYSQIFESESPESIVATLPSQTLYTLVKDRGIESSLELLEIIPLNAFRIFLDLDLWEKDSFHEDNLWAWLQLSDDEDPLRYPQRVLKSIDLKLVALLIGKHVQIQVFDEKSETPPGAGWFTPDQGYTWLFVNLEDTDKHFHLNRLLALLFETNTDLFYQILSIPMVSTLTQLEEEAFIDRGKRLAAEGVPESEQYTEINSSIFPYEIKQELESTQHAPKAVDLPVVEPVLAMSTASGALQPFDNAVMESSLEIELLQGEMTLIMNASLQFFHIPFYDLEQVKLHSRKVKGAINIGLEKALSLNIFSASECLQKLSLVKLYRLGLYELRTLHKIVKKITVDELQGYQSDPASFSIIAHLLDDFPAAPELFSKEGRIVSAEAGTLDTTTRPLEHLSDIQHLHSFLNNLLKAVPE